MKQRKQNAYLPTEAQPLVERGLEGQDNLHRIPNLKAYQRLRDSMNVEEGEEVWPEVFLTQTRKASFQKRKETIMCTDETVTKVERILMKAGVTYKRKALFKEVESENVRQLREMGGKNPERRMFNKKLGTDEHTWMLVVEISA